MDKEAFDKIEEFTNKALSEIDELRTKVASLEAEKEDSMKFAEANEDALKKAAQALYDSDYLSDSSEKKAFMKKAFEDSTYLPKIVERLCSANDVKSFGKVAKVKSAGDEEYDPVRARAFGYDANYSLLDE